MQYISEPTYTAYLTNPQCAQGFCNQKVPTSFYPYGAPINAAQWLQTLLDAPGPDHPDIAHYLQNEDLILALEPGRSLVDQAAISLFRITRCKQLADQQWVLFVEGSSFSACETWFASEFLVDPILISSQPITNRPAIGAYIAGHSCLDDDIISRRIIPFAVTPQPGDLLAFINTAGYQMDLLENEFHRHPLPTRLLAIADDDNNLMFSPDY